MNIKRGLFRIWLVLSVIWVGGVMYDYYGSILNPYVGKKEYRYIADNKTFTPHVEETDPMKWLEFGNTHTIMDFPYNLTLHAPNNLSDEDKLAVARRFAKEVVALREPEVSSKRWEYVKSAAKTAFTPVVAIFALGVALIWALSGFRKTA